MRLSAIVLPVCLLFLAPVFCQEPVFRTTSTLVHVVATVKDKAGQLVGTLQKDDFDIYDNGVRQEVRAFERQSAQPLSIVLMIDTSGSTGKDLKYETDSAARFLRTLLSEGNQLDKVSLYAVDADVKTWGFTHDYAALESRFRTLKGSGATALYAAIRWASQDLERREGRKAIIALTDGDDTYSRVTSHEALEAAQMADAVIYPVVVVPITNDAGRNIGGEHALQYMAERTGGRAFMPTVGNELDKAFSDILAELRTQYFLGFYPRGVPLSSDRFHKLEVRLKRPELQVSARNGYYGEVDAVESALPDPRVTPGTSRPAPSTGKKK